MSPPPLREIDRGDTPRGLITHSLNHSPRLNRDTPRHPRHLTNTHPQWLKEKPRPKHKAPIAGAFSLCWTTSRLRQGLSKGLRLSRLSSNNYARDREKRCVHFWAYLPGNNYARDRENLSKLDMSTTRARVCARCVQILSSPKVRT